jgi:hypothetical protein
MIRCIKLAGLIAALLVVLQPSYALAQEFKFGVSPAEVRIDDLPPGETSEFELTIHNKEGLAHNFTLTIFQPPEEERREGRVEFPDDSWISFSSQEIEIAAKSEASVTVTLTIPRELKWADKDWETWLAVTAESGDLLAVRLYTRLLVSTTPAIGARPDAGLVIGIVVGIVLFGFGSYLYFRRKARSGHF